MTLIEEFEAYCKEHALPDSVAVFALWNAWKEAEKALEIANQVLELD